LAKPARVALALFRTPTLPRSHPGASISRKGDAVPLLWVLVVLLLIFAIAGGVAVSKFLWLVLVVALIVALIAFASGRRAV
jgi:Flp pilus assembly protein TadB